MTVPQCVTAPGDEPLHGARRAYVVVVIVTIAVVVLACATGATPEWVSAVAALMTAMMGSTQTR